MRKLLVIAGVLSLVASGVHVQAQTRSPDQRELHRQLVHSMVQIRTWTRLGTGWLLAQDSGRPVIITNRHVVEQRNDFEIRYYQGASRDAHRGRARLRYSARDVDVAFLYPSEDPPPTARPLEFSTTPVVRGQHVIVGGHPGGLPFQTTEGVVTGHLPPSGHARRACGNANCFVIDAASFSGSSGGPVINDEGKVIGMLWGGPSVTVASTRGAQQIANSSFAFGILGSVLQDKLRAAARERQANGQTRRQVRQQNRPTVEQRPVEQRPVEQRTDARRRAPTTMTTQP